VAMAFLFMIFIR